MSDNPFDSYLRKDTEQGGSDPALLASKALLKPNASLEYCSLTVEETIRQLNTDAKNGIMDQQQVRLGLMEWGPNEVSADGGEPLWKRFLSTFIEDPLILLLIGSAIISFLMGNIDDAVSITLAIVIVVSVGFVQEYRSEKSLEALQKLVPASCHLIRNGVEKTVLAAELIPGDVVSVKVGDRVPADLRIIESVDLCVDESTLTGETEPMHKSNAAVDVSSYNDIPGGIIPISDRASIAFMGTLVREGHGKGVVVSTGKHTMFGTVFEMMNSIEKPKTPLQLAMDKLGKDLSYMSFFLIGIIFIIGVIQGRSWLEMFQISVSLAVAAIPEGLPIIVTVTLALGVLRMASRKAIVSRLPSVETLGSVNVICSDKTGTLTANHMTASKIWCLGSMANKNNVLVVESKSLNGLNKGQKLSTHLTEDVRTTLKIGSVCNNASYSHEHAKYLGNPTDIALVEVLAKFGMDDERQNVRKIEELSFNSKRKFMAVKVDNGSSPHKHVVYIKGAFEKIVEKSSFYMSNTGKVEKLTDSHRAIIDDCARSLASEGLRILAFAQVDIPANKALTEGGFQNLVFTGLVGMKDPPRATVRPAIEELLQGGVHVIMITGDSENTAVNIARQIGIPVINPEISVLTGDKLDRMTDDQLAGVIDHVNIFARATPEHKLNIVRALQKRGDIVAMTGDGVNDAPALKLADIGVAMGHMGTDVAKEASDMVLTDDDFSTILTAIEEGKGIFNNIQNFLTFQLSTSVATLSLVALAIAFKLPNPLNAMQILWVNILMDGPPAQSLGVEPVDQEVRRKPPRKRTDKILTTQVMKRLLINAAFIIVGTIYVFVKEMTEDNQITARDTTMTFTCFVFFDMFSALSCRHATKSIFEIGLFNNKMFNYAVGFSLIGQLCAIYVPFFQSIFKTESLSIGDLLYLLVISSSVFIADEVRKYYAKKNAVQDSYYFSMV
ncbi:HFL052Wp [Eremothecium sinecaudum]|uniref:Calcium-transporting ATPase n=1 Tax=Eremothecium sinecaudum TaxID=45286 RepID=A0A0X8HUS3_9SACH|nr:HFL052Wp [Eremothecium sinecaudum]AMD21804.1 HFL052Wp [Eremothecium sinecaudum]